MIFNPCANTWDFLFHWMLALANYSTNSLRWKPPTKFTLPFAGLLQVIKLLSCVYPNKWCLKNSPYYILDQLFLLFSRVRKKWQQHLNFQMASPGSRLSDKLRRKIEEIGRTDRKDVVGQTADGCAPLFWACKNGSAEVVDYLLTTCEADIEQVLPNAQMLKRDSLFIDETNLPFRLKFL